LDARPYAEMGDVDNGVGIFRFVHRERNRSRNLTGHGHQSAGWKCGRIEKVALHGDESALRLREIIAWLAGPVEWKLKDFDPSPFLQASRIEHLASEHDRLSFERVRCRLDLRKCDLVRS
jgi:hypothetical protein